VLSSDDPVRVFERFSTLNAISSGRAEVIVGRGSFTESFPLFGYDLANYEELFEENLNLFAELSSRSRSRGRGGSARRSPISSCIRPAKDRSTPGSAWVAAPNRWSVLPSTACR
jgi:alkanesulfonate monooxygenase SsuD/methylene tetrahydromethanopterin reductase-like flavin-dependent oxidoreductase (luciferase family)